MLTISILIATVILFYLAFCKDRVEVVTGPTESPKNKDNVIDDCLEELGYRRG